MVRERVWLPMEVLDRIGPKQTNVLFYYPACGEHPKPLTTDTRYTHRKPKAFIVLGEPV